MDEIYSSLYPIYITLSQYLNTLTPFYDLIIKKFCELVRISPHLLEVKDEKICYQNVPLTVCLNIERNLTVEAFSEEISRVFNEIFCAILKENGFSQNMDDIGKIHDLWQEKFIISDYINTPYTKAIEEKIQNKNYLGPLAIIGESASGKTSAMRKALGRRSYVYLDMIAAGMNPASFLTTIINHTSSSQERSIVLIDNFQTNPGCFSWIPDMLEIAQKLTSKKYLPVFLTWPNALPTIKARYPNIDEIYMDGNKTISALIAYYKKEKYESDILKNCRGDALAAKEILAFTHENSGQVPNKNEIAEDIYLKLCNSIYPNSNCLEKSENDALFLLSCINQFEIPVEEIFFEEEHLLDAIHHLKENGVIRYYIDENGTQYFSVGHRSKAYFLYIYLQNIANNPRFNKDEQKISKKYGKIDPKEIAINYLKRVGFDEQLYQILQRLDLNSANPQLSKLWKRFERIKSNFEKQCSKDITWGNNIASMVFACNAFGAMKYDTNFGKYLHPAEKKIYEKWSINEDETALIFIDDPKNMTSEMNDFKIKIKQTMKEDENLRVIPSHQKVEKIDFDLFHHSWLLGLLLGEAGVSQNNELKNKLISLAKNMQEIDGNFYPARVPWVTARVILGFADCGYTYATSKIVQEACDWLVDQITNDVQWSVEGMNSPGWFSGTGTWNSNEQITIMNLCSLIAVNYPTYNHAQVKKAIHEFTSHYKELHELFCKKEVFLDSMWIVDLLAKSDMSSDNYLPLLIDILDTALTKWSDATKGVEEKNNESSDMAFLAKELLDIIWKTLTENIQQILGNLDFSYNVHQRKKSIFISYRRDFGGTLAQDIYIGLEHNHPNDVFLDVIDLHEKPNDIGFKPEIEKALLNSKSYIVILSIGCYDRVLKDGYKIEDDVMYFEMDTALKSNKRIIPVIGGQKFSQDLNQLKEKNKEFYETLLKIMEFDGIILDYSRPNETDRLIGILENKLKAK